MTQQQKDELNKELCGLLGICWHEVTTTPCSYGYMHRCSCGVLAPDGNVFIDPEKHSNPDFTSEAGRVQLLKLMFERKGFDKFIDLMVNPYNFILYLRDDNGAFAIAARDFLKAMEAKE